MAACERAGGSPPSDGRGRAPRGGTGRNFYGQYAMLFLTSRNMGYNNNIIRFIRLVALPAQPAVLAPLAGRAMRDSLSCMSQLPHHLERIPFASADYSCIHVT